jgi:hypothetical protein
LFPHSLPSPLFDQADPDNVAPAGGDPAADHPEGGEPQDPPTQPAITMEALLSALAQKLPSLIEPVVAKQVNGLAASVDKKFKALEPKKEAPKPDAAAAENPYWSEEKTELLTRLTALENAKNDAERRAAETEVDTKLSSALSTFQWREGRQQTVFRLLRNEIQKNDDGSLTIGGLAFDKYIRERVPREYDGFLVAREQGGAGASGKSANPQGSANILDKIKPGMSKDDLKLVQSALSDAVKAQGHR